MILDELDFLKDTREKLQRKYHRTKDEETKKEISSKLKSLKPKIKELYKYDKYCNDITKRAEKIQKNLNNFDKDIQKEKDNAKY